MRKLVAGLLGLAVLAVIVLVGAISLPSSGTAGETSSISDYRADFTVSADGDLDVVETLSVSFPVPRHGIFRFFDTRDNPGSDGRVIPEDVTVTRDGAAEPYERLSERRGRYVTLKIGSAGTTISGPHVYRIGYHLDGVLTKGHGGAPTQLYWDLIPSGWQMPINESRLTVHLPADAQGVRCAVGVGATAGDCTADGDGTRTLTVVTGGLAPNTPVTIRTGLDIPTPEAGHALPWPGWLDPVLGRHPVVLGVVVGLALLSGLAGFALTRSTHERTPPYPLMYAPPDGIGPAQAAYILTEKVDDKAFVASMMYAAEQGAVQLDQDGSRWKITGAGDDAAWGRVDGVTRLAGQSLGVLGSGSFSASPKSAGAGQKLKAVLSAFEANTKGWARTSGLMAPSGLGGFGCFVLLAVWALTIWLGAFNPFDMSAIALIPGFFAVFGLGVGMAGAGTKRTPAGRDLWSRVGGFRRILSTPSAVDRFDFSGRKELYTAYLPWAVALDCADEWAKKYRVETGEEPPAPAYFVGYSGAHTGNYVSQMVDSFDSAVSSAISSYEATQQSSSSGGGGFSGGGGGGGGGGGSW